MDMTGEERIAASREAVWAALNDVEVLRQCIPGCESLEKQSDTEMTDVGGKLAQLGGRLIDSTSKKLAGEFFQKFSAIVGPAPAGAAPPAKEEGWFRRLWRWLFGRKAETSA